MISIARLPRFAAHMLAAALFATQSPAFAFEVTPRAQRITLGEETQLSISLAPDLGTRFSFPFALDDPSLERPFTVIITNPVFKLVRQPGRDFFIVEVDPEGIEFGATYHGNMFLSVGTYTLVATLRTSNDLRHHISDYRFELNEQDKTRRLQRVINRHLNEANDTCKQRLREQANENKARSLALWAQLSGIKATRLRINEKRMLRLQNKRGSLSLIVRALERFNQVSVLSLQFANRSAERSSLDKLNLFAEKPGRAPKAITLYGFRPTTLGSSGKTELRIAANDQALWDSSLSLRLVADTRHGRIELSW